MATVEAAPITQAVDTAQAQTPIPIRQPSEIQDTTQSDLQTAKVGMQGKYELDDGSMVRVFSTDGKAKPIEQFHAVMDAYKTKLPNQDLISKAQTPGFTVLPDGSMQAGLRQMFNKVMTPIQKNVVEPINNEMQKPGILGSLLRTNPIAVIGGEQGDAIKTPGGLGASAALAPTGLFTKKISGALPIAAKSLSAAVGYFLGEEGTGGFEGKSVTNKALQSLVVAGTVAATEGGFVGLKRALGISVGQEAEKSAHEGIMKVMVEKYPYLMNSGKAGVDAMISTKQGVQYATQVGIKSLKGESDNAMLQFTSDLKASLPAEFDKEVIKGLSRHIKQYGEASNKYFDGIGNSVVQGTAKKSMDNAKESIKTDLVVEFKRIAPNLSSEGLLKNAITVRKIMDQYGEAEGRFLAGAEVIDAFKKSGQESGFSATKLQEYVKDKYMSKRDPANNTSKDNLYEQVALAASRVSGNKTPGTDSQIGVNLRIPGVKNIPYLKDIGFNIKGGTKYTGDFPQTNVSLPLNMSVIGEYLNKRDK